MLSVKNTLFQHFCTGHNGTQSNVFHMVANFRASHSVVCNSAYDSRPGDMLLQISKANKYKATIGVPVALFKLCEAEASSVMLPLASRFSMADVPCQAVGSILHPLKKHKASDEMGNIHAVAKSFRDVSLFADLGKVVLRDFRTRIVPGLSTYILSSQYGGFLRRGTDFTTHHLRAKTNIARLSNMSFAVLYVDVHSAFMAMQRYLVIDSNPTDANIAAFFKHLGLKPVFFHEFCEFVRSTSACTDAGISSELHSVLSSLLANSWFVLQGLDALCEHSQGSIAGSPLADVVFMFAIAKVLRIFFQSCHDSNLLDREDYPIVDSIVCPGGTHESTPSQGPSYFDDLAVAIMDHSARTLLFRLRSIAAIAIDVFAGHGMPLNLAQGKTEASIKFRGEEAHIMKAEIWCHMESSAFILVVSRAFGTCRLYCTYIYVHMGSRHPPDCNYLPEIMFRSESSFTALIQNKPLLRSNKTPVQSRLMLMKAKALTKLTYNTCSLASFTPAMSAKFSFQYARSYRHAHNIPCTEEDHCSPEQLYYDYEVLPPEEHLRSIRLNYLNRFIQHAPISLKHIVNYEFQLDHDSSSFLSRVYNDLDLYYSGTLGPPLHNPVEWHDRIVLNDAFIPDLVASFKSSFVNPTPLPNAPKTTPLGERIQCHICAVWCASAKVLNGHLWKTHKVKQQARFYAFDNHCPICMRLYPARANLVTHLARYANDNSCMKTLQLHFTPLSRSDVDLLDAEDLVRIRKLKKQGLCKTHSSAPILRVQGPPNFFNVL